MNRSRILDDADQWLALLPLLIVLCTFLFLLLIFLVCILLVRRRRGISLRDHDGPIDLSREDLLEGDGGFEAMESRWLEVEPETSRRQYLRARDYQLQHPAASQPTDITLSQFLSIQEKGVSAWSFDVSDSIETLNSLLVHARTEITFLPDPSSSSSVQSNLPLPKLNEVYYWEVKLFDLPETTNVAIGLATKPYPSFRLPGHSRFSVAYHSNGDKSHNYPFTATPFGARLKEGDVLGVGYRPRTGAVFFTRNGRKVDSHYTDAFIGLTKWNLFPTVGADGPCSVHVNLGQAGFVFVEANVKRWGLAPSVGTLAPPPAYGSERGSILLDVGGRSRAEGARRSRRNGAFPSSPLRNDPITPPPPITPIHEGDERDYDDDDDDLENENAPLLGIGGQSYSSNRYISPTDRPFHTPQTRLPPSLILDEPEVDPSRPLSPEPSTRRSIEGARNPFITSTSSHARSNSQSHSRTHSRNRSLNAILNLPSLGSSDSAPSETELRGPTLRVHPPPESPLTPSSSMHNPPTPGVRDIHLQALPRSQRRSDSYSSETSETETDQLRPALSRRPSDSAPPPAYSPLDAVIYADGVHIDLPAEVIQAALEGNAIPDNSVGQRNVHSSSRRR